MTIEATPGLKDGMAIFGQSLESFLTPFVNIITFGMDVASGLIIGISALFGLFSFLMVLAKQPRAITSQGNHKTAFGKWYVACNGFSS